MAKLTDQVGSLTTSPGVYLFCDSQGEVLYVGKSVNVHDRIKQHLASPYTKGRALVSASSVIKAIPVSSELEALLLEASLIKKHLPRYNSAAKDDKHPLYIKLTKDEYPKVTTSRKEGNKAYYFGPFPSSSAVRSVLKQVRRIFPFHSHNKVGKKPCLYSHLGLCKPCPAYIEQIQNQNTKIQMKKEYRKNIQRIRDLLSGKSKTLRKILEKEMRTFARNQNFEQAANIRDQIQKLEYITRPYKDPKEYLENPNLLEDLRQNELDDLYKLLKPHFKYLKYPKRIECYDVSHLSGRNAASSMVAFVNGETEKSFYRHFRIRIKNSSDDYLMLSETLKRRFKHFSDWGKPDLIVIDGGKGQVGAARLVMKENNVFIPVIGLAKRLEEIIVPRIKLNQQEPDIKASFSKLETSFTIFRLSQGTPALSLLQRMRDEAHRFARKLHFKYRLQELKV